MVKSEAQRILLQHRYRTALPFPISTAFSHYNCSPTRNNAIRAWRLVTAAESTVRYVAIVAACDYATDPAADRNVLQWLRQEWCGSRALSFGSWSNGLMKILKEYGKSWESPFLPEFGEVSSKRLISALEPLMNARNKLAHGERMEALSYQHFVRQHEESLFAILSQLEFLARYQLCFAEVEEDEGMPREGSSQTINLCRGASRSFLQCTIAPSKPIPPGVPFIWNAEFDGVLLLSPFFVYGRASTKPQGGGKGPNSSLTAHLQGLMVLNRARGRDNYVSLDEEAHISLDAFLYPVPADIDKQLGEVLTSDAASPARLESRLSNDEKKKFGRQPGDVSVGYTFKGEKDTYTVEQEPIGRGGMGVVYLVRRESDGMLCALKAMPLDLMAIGSLVKRFEREGRVLLELSREGNPNVVRLLDMGYQEPTHFLVMEYVEGGSLADELWRRSGRRPPFAFGEALGIIEQVCTGARVIHHRGLIHRDLKPGNILLAPQEGQDGELQGIVPKITDFGLARRIGQQSVALTAELGALGTFQYMPPEQFEDTGIPIDQRADVYAIGKILAEMLTGVVPRTAREVETLNFAPLKEEAASEAVADEAESPVLPGEVPIEGIKRILTCALAKDPRERFESVADLVDALHKAAQIDEADQQLDDIGIYRPDVRAAFGLARIGHPQATKRLLRWCASADDLRHREAAVAMAALGEAGLKVLIRTAEDAQAEADSREKEGLVQALAHAWRWKEDTDPRILGQSWLKEINKRLYRKVKQAHFSEGLERAVKELAPTFAHYTGLGTLLGVLAGLVFTLFEASVFWRVSTGPGKPFAIRVLFSIGPWACAPFLWASAGALMGWTGALFSRPKRYLVILGAGGVLGLVVGLLGWLLAYSAHQPVGEINKELGQSAALAVFQSYWWWQALLGALGLCAAFAFKALPFVQRRRPNLAMSLASFVGLVTLFCLPVALRFTGVLYPRETFGTLATTVAACGVGCGLADWFLDRKRLEGKSIEAA